MAHLPIMTVPIKTAPIKNPGLRIREGGSGEPLLLLLHGLGATSDVWEGWRPVLAQRWPGRWIAPDLPGHGGSPAQAEYTFESVAAAVAQVLPPGTELVVLGHSLGGVIALTLAAGRFDLRVAKAIGLGIKTAWTQAELDRARAFARRPAAWFSSRDEAAARYLRISGLDGLLPADDPAIDAGLRHQDGQWRLAFDPRTFAVGAPDLPHLLAAISAPVVLARGQHDPMNSDEQLEDLGVQALTLPGLHHNAHVENPDLCAAILESP
jgi:pimeloyl-ACP methyl ester carboxylesterase